MDVLSIILSVLAITVSSIAIWFSIPRLKINGLVASVFSAEGNLGSVVQARVSNNGGASATIFAIEVRSRRGHVSARPDPSLRGPGMPYEIAPRGGVGVWNFDYENLRRQAADNFWTKPMRVDVVVTVGTKRKKSRGRIFVNPPGVFSADESSFLKLRRRLRDAWQQSLLLWCAVGPDDDPTADTYTAVATKRRGGIAAPRYLAAAAQAEGQIKRKLDSIPVIKVRRAWPWEKRMLFEVPLLDGTLADPGEQLYWYEVDKDGVAGSLGHGAITVGEYRESARKMRQEQER